MEGRKASSAKEQVKSSRRARYGCGYQKKSGRMRLKTVHVLSIMCPCFQGSFTMPLCRAFWKLHSGQLVLSARNSFACVPRQLKPFRTKGKEHREVKRYHFISVFCPSRWRQLGSVTSSLCWVPLHGWAIVPVCAVYIVNSGCQHFSYHILARLLLEASVSVVRTQTLLSPFWMPPLSAATRTHQAKCWPLGP